MLIRAERFRRQIDCVLSIPTAQISEVILRAGVNGAADEQRVETTPRLRDEWAVGEILLFCD